MTRKDVINEIQQIPDEKMNVLYEIVHQLRIEFECENNGQKILKYAGTWSDMPESDYGNLMNDIRNRRKAAFQYREKGIG